MIIRIWKANNKLSRNAMHFLSLPCLGGYCIYTALAVAAGELDPNHIPNLNKTAPTDDFGPFPQA